MKFSYQIARRDADTGGYLFWHSGPTVRNTRHR